MKRYLNRFIIVSRQNKLPLILDNNRKYLDSIQEAKEYILAYCKVFKWKPSMFQVMTVDGYPVETENFSGDENKALKKDRVFSGKGLKVKTFEHPNDAKYKSAAYESKDISFAKSVEKFKGQPVIFKQVKRVKPQTNTAQDVFKVLERLPDAYSIEHLQATAKTRLLGYLMRSPDLNKVDLYRKFKGGKLGISNSQLHKIIGSL